MAAHPHRTLALPPKKSSCCLLKVAVEHDFGSTGVFAFDEGEEIVCYMIANDARELLHLPPHIFDLLGRCGNWP